MSYFVFNQVGTVLIDERQEKVSPELQALIESEVKRLIKVSVHDFDVSKRFVYLSVSVLTFVFINRWLTSIPWP